MHKVGRKEIQGEIFACNSVSFITHDYIVCHHCHLMAHGLGQELCEQPHVHNNEILSRDKKYIPGKITLNN